MNTKIDKKITIKTLNQTGHSEITESLEDAILTTIQEYFQRGRFAYVNHKYFQFSAESANDAVALMQDTVKLREMLEEDGEVIVTLGGDLRGGN